MASLLAWHPHFGSVGGSTLQEWLAAHPEPVRPSRAIALATEERTGSEYLCQLLAATGCLGRPSEYLNTYWMRRFIPDYPDEVEAQIAIAHRVGTTPNGCFAMKMHAVHLDRLLGAVRLTTAFPNPIFVRLFRRDLLGQAISLYRARQANQYHAHVLAEREARFDAEAIRGALIELVRGRARWELYIARNGLRPLAIAYEDMVANPDATIRAIARHAGLDAVPADVDRPLQVQRDDTSEAWRERFLTECGDLDVLKTI